MEFTAAAIAGFLKGEIVGDPEVKVNTVARIEEGHPGALSFLANPKYEQFLYTTESSIVLVSKDLKPSGVVRATMIKVPDAYEAFASLLLMVDQSRPRKMGIHPTAVIEQSAKIGTDVYIGANAYIGENCTVGDRCRIYPQTFVGDNTIIGSECLIYAGVKIYHDCIVGNNCTIHAGTVIGSDGFGFAPQSDNQFMKIPQIGNVVIEDNVEIGANSAIDRATMGSTVIRKGVKLDNLVQIGHNVEIGENTVMAALSGVAGSAKIGRNCMFGGQTGIAGHLKVADGTKVGAQAGIAGDVKEANTTLLGSPAIEHLQYLKSFSVFRKLPELKSKIDMLAKRLDPLQDAKKQ